MLRTGEGLAEGHTEAAAATERRAEEGPYRITGRAGAREMIWETPEAGM